ncbi:unnamed protein product [Acanthoscelides obtectus]|uniref:Uncharacterized protein n=1 Tax=Acanthoscelides obtectus TaxID=200917 RepID=A0A9P0KA93_ACAOB|nr:unnamed protein product [Acanthoscelides obtectus]CAK1651888.1 hypothetical protein AOBTE_LOCUS17523 [Acanthoscelides obtectus]
MSSCPILAKREYVTRHDRVAKILHHSICTDFDIDVKQRWYEHEPQQVVTATNVTIPWNQPIITDRTIAANKPDIVIKYHKTARKHSGPVLPPRWLEIAVAVDHTVIAFHGKDKVEQYVLSLLNIIDRAVAVDAGIRILPKTEDNYYRIVRLFREKDVPYRTFPLPSERNIHAVVGGTPAMFSEQQIKGELEQMGHTPLHIIRLKRSGGAPMPLVVVILPQIEKSQQLFNNHELRDVAI